MERGTPRGAGPVEHWAGRRLYMDNLKVVLIAAIVVAHALVGYSEVASWTYAEIRETTLSPVTEVIGFVVVGPFALAMIPLLFLIAGLFTPGSVGRKGPGPYTRERLLRLGVPFAVFVLAVWPVLLFALYRTFGQASASYWREFLGTVEEPLDTGYMWFVGDLLIFSLGYAGWVRLRGDHTTGPAGRAGPPRITARRLAGLAALVAIASFVTRTVFPVDDDTLVDLNLWQWPSCIAMFELSVVASRADWATAVPAALARRSRTATLVSISGFAVFMGVAALLGLLDDDVWRGGWNLIALAFTALESVFTLFGAVWLLSVAQRRLDRRFRWAPPAVGRSAYGAFLLQGLPLIGLAVLLRPLPLPAELKALLVATGSVTASFALAWLLIRRVPGMARIL